LHQVGHFTLFHEEDARSKTLKYREIFVQIRK